MTLDELLRGSDFISIHLPKTPETAGLIGERELGLVKPGAIIVNAARGGLVDEHALAQALKEGRLAGAAIDVFATEPCTDSPVFADPNAVVTPHLGASTAEAQDKAGLAVARSVKLALAGDFVPDAVNVQAGGVVAEEIRPSLPLTERLGRLFTALAGGVPASLTVEIKGEIAAYDVSVLQLAALRGVFTDVVEEQVTFVNAPLLAAERGVEVGLVTSQDSPDYRNVLTVRGALADGTVVSVGGNLTGPRLVQKLVEVNGFDIEVALNEHMVFVTYEDRPGIVGIVGQLLGQAGINIAGMQVSRTVGGRRGADGAHGRLGDPAGDAGGDRARGRCLGDPRRAAARGLSQLAMSTRRVSMSTRVTAPGWACTSWVADRRWSACPVVRAGHRSTWRISPGCPTRTPCCASTCAAPASRSCRTTATRCRSRGWPTTSRTSGSRAGWTPSTCLPTRRAASSRWCMPRAIRTGCPG